MTGDSECTTTLTGLKNNVENKFYFRCEDQPKAAEQSRNKNQESYEFNLMGTIPLVISSAKPNETVTDSTDVISVELEIETSAGHDEGNATCYYSETDDEIGVLFFETNSHKHTQTLGLSEGSYEYFITCIDLGGNENSTTIKFDVESDFEAPTVVRAYRERDTGGDYLKIITDEKAECVYSKQSEFECNYLFEDGIEMSAVDDTNHFTEWSTETDLFIKCKDEYNRQPEPDKCSIIARAFEV